MAGDDLAEAEAWQKRVHENEGDITIANYRVAAGSQ